MATENIGFVRSREAAASLTTKQHYIVKLDSNGKIALADSATGLVVGVLQNTPDASEQAVYAFGGTAKVKAGGTVAIGDWVTTNASGKAIATTTAGDVVIGRALEAAVADDIFEVQLEIFRY